MQKSGHRGLIRAFSLVLLLFLFCGCSAKREGTAAPSAEGAYPVHKLLVNGEDISGYTIVYDADAGASVKKAAEELQYYIRYASGAELAVSADTGAEKRLYVHASDEDTEDFSYHSDENGIVISGGKTRGALYGVYDFLENQIGMRFLAKDTELCHAAEKIDLRDLDYSYTQYFSIRDPYFADYFDSAISAKRMINSSYSRDIPAELGGCVRFAGRTCHTMEDLCGADQHSEQPCLCDESVYETVLANVLALLRENPDADIVSVSQNDNENYCRCEQCRAIDEEEGSHAGTIIRFVNRIAEEVEKEFPDVMIHTFAYRYSRTPPKLTKPRQNVLVQLCSIECCFNHPLNDETCELNAAFKSDIEGWAAICDNLYIWDYHLCPPQLMVPFPDFDILAENVRFFYENHAIGIFAQGEYQLPSGEFAELRSYLLSLLMKNPYMTDTEFDDAVNEFLQGFYGEGWQSIRKYYDLIMELSNGAGHFGIYDDCKTILRAGLLRQYSDDLVRWFDDALALAETDLQKDHVRRLRTSCEYMRLSAICGFVLSDEDKAAYERDAERLYQDILEFNTALCEWSTGMPHVRFDTEPWYWHD